MILKYTILRSRFVPRLLSFPKRNETSTTAAPAPSGHDDAKIPAAPADSDFETVFRMPHIRYIALFNRLKLYSAAGTLALLPSCGVLGTANAIPMEVTLIAGYIGVTSTILLSVFSYFTKNIIGFIYISKDNEHIKISTVDYWGLRRNRVVPVSDWVPLNDLPHSNMNAFYLSPRLESNPNFSMKLIVKLGIVLDKQKVGMFLE